MTRNLPSLPIIDLIVPQRDPRRVWHHLDRLGQQIEVDPLRDPDQDRLGLQCDPRDRPFMIDRLGVDHCGARPEMTGIVLDQPHGFSPFTVVAIQIEDVCPPGKRWQRRVHM
ncbi:hypothetical protein [Kineosporia rhizophila]|uniref:hypothetical protein n=1 Tax=Kineosporia rhizophila TaxID=84633 RepID=UPI0038CC0192